MPYVRRPMAKVIEDFWRNVIKTDSCWEWQRSCDGFGYGQLSVHGRHMRAHTFSFELTHGPVQKGLCIMHSCDNPKCVNPSHLSLGTQRDNLRDMAAKGRSGAQKRTHCRNGHEYSFENTKFYKARGSKVRVCCICLAVNIAKSDAKRKEKSYSNAKNH